MSGGPSASAEQPSRIEVVSNRLPRSAAIDIVRGLVMVLMVLDHTRDFFTNATYDPLDLKHTTPGLFLTRLITHWCAPTFVFLAGMGAFLYGAGSRSRKQLATYLATRGVWLVFLEFTLVHLGWFFNFEYRLLVAQVIWAIGMSMIVLAALTYLLPAWLVAICGAALLAGHNAIDLLAPASPEAQRWLAYLQLRPGLIGSPVRPPALIMGYPFLPWLGIMALGYGFGAVWLRGSRRRLVTALLGVSAIALFVGLRWYGIYGEPRPWKAEQANTVNTALAFMDCTKYPPSLLYALMTLGPSLLLLAAFDRSPGPLGKILVVYGRVPLFFYLLHVPIIHAAAIALAQIRHGASAFLLDNPGFSKIGYPPDYGYDLPIVYLATLCVVVVLYPLCLWYGDYKRKHPSLWLSLL
jgi:uncharacterized membrane protein